MSEVSTRQLLEERKPDIYALAKNYGVKNIRVFGSVARGEDTENSDIDFLVTMNPERRIADVFALKRNLASLLGREIDLLEEQSLHWFVRPQILAEAVPL